MRNVGLKIFFENSLTVGLQKLCLWFSFYDCFKKVTKVKLCETNANISEMVKWLPNLEYSSFFKRNKLRPLMISRAHFYNFCKVWKSNRVYNIAEKLAHSNSSYVSYTNLRASCGLICSQWTKYSLIMSLYLSLIIY